MGNMIPSTSPQLQTIQTDIHGESPALSLSEQQHDLERQVLQSIVKSDGFVFTPETQSSISRLREGSRRHSLEKGKLGLVPVVVTFVTVVITSAVAAFVRWIEDLTSPPEGSVAIYNPGPPIRVWTCDETDGVRWIAYKLLIVGPGPVRRPGSFVGSGSPAAAGMGPLASWSGKHPAVSTDFQSSAIHFQINKESSHEIT